METWNFLMYDINNGWVCYVLQMKDVTLDMIFPNCVESFCIAKFKIKIK